MSNSTFRNRLTGIEDRIAAACTRSGRSPDEITLLGVSKRQSLERLREAVDAGLRVFGENQVQEAVAKSAELPANLDWHLIGHLQSNKAKAAARLFSTIHSIDRLKIARRLDREAEKLDRRLDVFLQINLGDEPSKHGLRAEELLPTLDSLRDLSHLRPVGLMAIPPFEEDQEKARAWFRELRRLRDQTLQTSPDFPGGLSMGMSHDFETAIEEGATHIRVGTSLFGLRPS